MSNVHKLNPALTLRNQFALKTFALPVKVTKIARRLRMLAIVEGGRRDVWSALLILIAELVDFAQKESVRNVQVTWIATIP